VSADRITELRVQGVRTLADVRLRLDGLTVLIGDNGSGKSTVIEVLEVLRKAAHVEDFLAALNQAHGGLPLLLRVGASEMTIGVTVEGDGPALDYSFTAVAEGGRLAIVREDVGPTDGDTAMVGGFRRHSPSSVDTWQPRRVSAGFPQFAPNRLALTAFSGEVAPEVARIRAALFGVEVHLPFEVRPRWLVKERGGSAPLREPEMPDVATGLSRLGDNLASAFHALKNEQPSAHWRETMDLVRLGLGEDVESINTQLSGGGYINIALELRGLAKQIPAAALSDGTLSYLAFVALARLGRERTLLAFDEPEAHLHPHLLARVLGLFEVMAEKHPVILATHSDRLLDALADPAASVVLCELNEKRETVLRRPSREALARWLERYRGIGDLRSEGYEAHVFEESA
jgi:predicted ATPase